MEQSNTESHTNEKEVLPLFPFFHRTLFTASQFITTRDGESEERREKKRCRGASDGNAAGTVGGIGRLAALAALPYSPRPPPWKGGMGSRDVNSLYNRIFP
ncbi:hypothetical protein JTE90_006210 [Oedothorax gibbosus]|uniref:Uncharacterized protein n=1 Tax=Oedothorax gibbosus TaxID=931172 RepID=A0AAV6VTI1_9ARAC|nr:hypothetical protein JTE90_006210 [Oedothorax gibbosus]